ncbi:MAG: caspase family protein, partial [Saprospiraceae bacterium]|nr:caspase family protein [Saprospiraceae bacterium]
RKADGNDVILFYFSGHGLDGAFLPIDFDGYGTRLEHTQIVRTLETSRAKHKICIADACYSGTLNFGLASTAKGLGNPISTQYFYEAFENSTGGMALLMSSSAREASWEDSGLEQGVFTYYLIKGMSGKADFDRDGIISVKELFGYVYHMVQEHTGGHQSPALTGDYDDEMPVSIHR